MPHNRRRHYSISQAARSLGFSYRHTRRLIAQGKLDATCERIGPAANQVRWTISADAIRRYKRRRAARRAK